MSHGYTRHTYIAGLNQQLVPHAVDINDTNLANNAREGTTVTSSASANTKGAYTELIAALSQDCYGITLRAYSPNAAATVFRTLLDLAAGAAGSESIVIPDLDLGDAAISPYGRSYFIPGFYIAAGTRISARIQSSTGSTPLVLAIFPELQQNYPTFASAAIAYGVDATNSRGTQITTGANAWGSWVEIAETTADHNYFMLQSDQGTNTGRANQSRLLQLGVGPDTGSIVAIGYATARDASSVGILTHLPTFTASPQPSGTKLWVRGADNSARNTGVIVTGI